MEDPSLFQHPYFEIAQFALVGGVLGYALWRGHNYIYDRFINRNPLIQSYPKTFTQGDAISLAAGIMFGSIILRHMKAAPLAFGGVMGGIAGLATGKLLGSLPVFRQQQDRIQTVSTTIGAVLGTMLAGDNA